MRWTGTAWEHVGPRGLFVGFSVFFNIVIASSGEPIIAYLDAGQTDANSTAKVVIQKYTATGAGWLNVGNFPVRSAGNYSVSLVNTEKDSLFVALAVDESAGAGEVYAFNGSFWYPVGDHVYNQPPTGRFPLLAVVPQGNKYVAYTDLTGERPQGRLKALRGTSWNEMPVGGIDFEVRGLAVGPEGVPWVLFEYQGAPSVWKMSFDP